MLCEFVMLLSRHLRSWLSLTLPSPRRLRIPDHSPTRILYLAHETSRYFGLRRLANATSEPDRCSSTGCTESLRGTLACTNFQPVINRTDALCQTSGTQFAVCIRYALRGLARCFGGLKVFGVVETTPYAVTAGANVSLRLTLRADIDHHPYR